MSWRALVHISHEMIVSCCMGQSLVRLSLGVQRQLLLGKAAGSFAAQQCNLDRVI